MSRRSISTFFAIIFTLYIAMPMIVTVIDKSFDVSVFFSVNEEEENETHKEQKLISSEASGYSFMSNRNNSAITRGLQNYSCPFVENTSPPPERI